MNSLSEYQFVKGDDGVYLAKILKNGNISKNSRKIENEEIIALFEDYLKDYCRRNVTNYLKVEHNNDASYFEAKLFVR